MNRADLFPKKFRGLRPGWSGMRLLPELLSLAEGEGVLDRMRTLYVFGHEDLCEALERDPGYDLSRGNRRRMIRLLVDLLVECGLLAPLPAGNRWKFLSFEFLLPPEDPPVGGEGDAQEGFFRRCMQFVPEYLRGENSAIAFDDRNLETWETFLGCDEFQAGRTLLLDRMGSPGKGSGRLLDLCHGPGWGVERALERWPDARISALDFTEAFAAVAKGREASARERNASRGIRSAPVEWFGPSDWKGFGYPLPFPENSFDAILFSCGDPYIPPGARDAVYAELHRILAPEGKLGILTRGYPDPERRHVFSVGVRITTLVHDFLESVCLGWHGFPRVETYRSMFSRIGFRGAFGPRNIMSTMESTIWILRKR